MWIAGINDKKKTSSGARESPLATAVPGSFHVAGSAANPASGNDSFRTQFFAQDFINPAVNTPTRRSPEALKTVKRKI